MSVRLSVALASKPLATCFDLIPAAYVFGVTKNIEVFKKVCARFCYPLFT